MTKQDDHDAWQRCDMNKVVQIDRRLAALRAALKRLKAERRVAVLREQERQATRREVSRVQ